MKKPIQILILLLAVAVFSPYAAATHILGTDISYRHVSGSKYEISITYYRYCNGVAMANPSQASRVRCVASGNTVGLNLTLKSLRNITPICASASKPCNPSNTGFSGDGVEEYVYAQTVDFTDSTFNAIYNCGGEVIVETGQCCRNSSITTGAQNANFYTFASLNFDLKTEQNSSPVFGNVPVFKAVANQPLMISVAALDTIDHDSVSFKFVEPLSSYGVTVPYSANFHVDAPITAYWPAAGYPFRDPQANPPVGVYLDSYTGTLITTPTKIGEETVFVVEVTEWRKDSGGTYKIISKTRRDAQLNVIQGVGNNNPQVLFDTSFTVTKFGAGCIPFVANDIVNIPPPPLKAANDTLSIILIGENSHLKLQLDSTVYGATATQVFGKVCYDSIWSSKGDNNIYLHVKDNACPLNGEATVSAFTDFNKLIMSSPTLKPVVQMKIYPNPTNDVIHIQIPSNQYTLMDADIQLIDLMGQSIMEIKEDMPVNEKEVSLNHLSNGTYFLHISAPNYSAHQTVILNR